MAGASRARYQVVARYFPLLDDGTNQAHKFVTGNTRAELVAAAHAGLPQGGKHELNCIWATAEGPLIWVPDQWLPAADEYVGR